MGLNYRRRVRREDLDPQNDFISASIGAVDIDWASQDEHLILDFESRILNRAERKIRNLDFSGRS